MKLRLWTIPQSFQIEIKIASTAHKFIQSGSACNFMSGAGLIFFVRYFRSFQCCTRDFYL